MKSTLAVSVESIWATISRWSTLMTRSPAPQNTATTTTTSAPAVMRSRSDGRRRRRAAVTAHPRCEAVALAAHRLDAVPAVGLVELAAEVADVHLDDVGVTVEGRAPHRLEQLGLADGLVGVVEQAGEHLHLTRGQVDDVVARDAPAAERVESQIADGRPVDAAARTAQQGPHPRLEHDHREGLGEEVVGPGLEPSASSYSPDLAVSMRIGVQSSSDRIDRHTR